jgi:putative phosphoribosyl transferase
VEHTGQTFDLPALRGRARVFRDRAHAGVVLARMMEELRGTDALVFAIPAGGVPVAAELARELALPLELAPVSKITLPWNTESGYGAVAFDGTVRLNEPLIDHLGLERSVVEEGIAKTKAKVARRVRELCGDQPLPDDLTGRSVALVDDGLASGFTLLTAVDAMRHLNAERIVVAVPTGHARAVARISAEVDAVYCPNVRDGSSFAVAEAYAQWADVEEATVLAIMRRARATAHSPSIVTSSERGGATRSERRRTIDRTAAAGVEPDELAHVATLEIRVAIEEQGGPLELGVALVRRGQRGGAERVARGLRYGFTVDEDGSQREHALKLRPRLHLSRYFLSESNALH